jgi:glycosyltransferase involved in cell wall biosynthesis
MISISFVIPTLNAAKVLRPCLESIKKQKTKYKYEILIADGGSTDGTLNLAKNFRAKILKNPLKTAEAGKAVGIKQAIGEYICLIDSDNILPNNNWLNKMLEPFTDPQIIGSEPISFTYRKKSGLVERYSALIGANDPYAFVTGIYDRFSYINNKWTKIKLQTTDFKKYIKIKLEKNKAIPTIGANGTIFRKKFLECSPLIKGVPDLPAEEAGGRGIYFFDIDIISQQLQKKSPLYFAKVKTGIIHTYCENSIKKFIRKQNRRVVDYYTYKNLRTFNWTVVDSKKFIFYTILIFPMLFDLTIGYIHKPDNAWFFHPLACFITLYVYSINIIKKKLNLIKPIDRHNWKQ